MLISPNSSCFLYQVKIENTEGTVCPSHWTNEEAEIVCRHEGYDFYRAVSSGHYPPTEKAAIHGPWFRNLRCEEDEKKNSFLECESSPLRSTCRKYENQTVGVICWKGKNHLM